MLIGFRRPPPVQPGQGHGAANGLGHQGQANRQQQQQRRRRRQQQRTTTTTTRTTATYT